MGYETRRPAHLLDGKGKKWFSPWMLDRKHGCASEEVTKQGYIRQDRTEQMRDANGSLRGTASADEI